MLPFEETTVSATEAEVVKDFRFETGDHTAVREQMIAKANADNWGILHYRLELAAGGSITVDPRKPVELDGVEIAAIVCQARQK